MQIGTSKIHKIPNLSIGSAVTHAGSRFDEKSHPSYPNWTPAGRLAADCVPALAGLRCDALTAPFVIDAPMDRRIFETYVKTQLAPTLGPGDVVILDNWPTRNRAAAEQALHAKGAWFLFLPPCSPDLNPIETAFAKLRALLRGMAIRTIDALWRAIGEICESLQSSRVPKLLRRRRLRIHMNVRRSSSLSDSGCL